jgi:hypothetical protein
VKREHSRPIGVLNGSTLRPSQPASF